jgi:hypothetical protein
MKLCIAAGFHILVKNRFCKTNKSVPGYILISAVEKYYRNRILKVSQFRHLFNNDRS